MKETWRPSGDTWAPEIYGSPKKSSRSTSGGGPTLLCAAGCGPEAQPMNTRPKNARNRVRKVLIRIPPFLFFWSDRSDPSDRYTDDASCPLHGFLLE